MTESWELRLRRIFLPYATARMETAKEQQTKLVYYTSAETAKNIIANKEVWMRNATTMNDFMEVQHGWQCLLEA